MESDGESTTDQDVNSQFFLKKSPLHNVIVIHFPCLNSGTFSESYVNSHETKGEKGPRDIEGLQKSSHVVKRGIDSIKVMQTHTPHKMQTPTRTAMCSFLVVSE